MLRHNGGMEHLAIDIGASSGKIIAGTLSHGVLATKEVYRFPNGYRKRDGHLVWDPDVLYAHVVEGLAEADRQGIVPATIAIDTWGCDYVLLDGTGARIGEAYAYRDGRTKDIACPVPWPELYRRTGIQRLSFNTVYQLLAHRAEHPDELERARAFVMVPDYLAWRLTGTLHQEYTNATTTALVDAFTRTWDRDLIRKLGLPEHLFGPLSRPGDVYGPLREEVARRVGYRTTVLAAPTHDTASAVAGSPVGEDDAFLSSGTWSLLGCVLKEPVTGEAARAENFTNEGGVDGTIRLLRNLMGTWMLQNLRKEWDGEISFPAMARAAEEAKDFPSRVDIEDERFLSPASMCGAVSEACAASGQQVPRTLPETASCIYHSLAEGYAGALGRLERITGKTMRRLAVVGGGSKDALLCQWTADACGKEVTAGPDEGTAFGNLLCQMVARRELAGWREAREVLRRSVGTKTYRRKEA